MSATDETPPGPDRVDSRDLTAYQEVQRSPEFQALRARWRRFVFSLSALFLAWFMVYVLLSTYAKGFVNITLGDTNITLGLVLGLVQFVTTFVIATVYVRYASQHLDPEASRLRQRVEEKL